jgi:cytoplasmic iron level regulating protein YaaA (DUF328/UPF0246 family)
MLIVISPAKKLDFENKVDAGLSFTRPEMLKASEDIIDVARGLSHKQMTGLMKISDPLVELNRQRYQDFSTPFTKKNAKQAALAFIGDTYLGLDAQSFSSSDYNYAQDYLRILSGLYGLLRPLDLIQAYRLEMGIKLKTARGKNLYEFWGNEITFSLNKAIAKTNSQFLLNCASNEYIKVVKAEKLKAEVITPVFKQVKNGESRMIGMMAKRARGAMARFVIQNGVDRVDDLKDFQVQGYKFQPKISESRQLVFHRQA